MSDSTHSSPETRQLSDPPGGLLLWIVVGLELVTFSIVFLALALYRGRNPAEFASRQSALDPQLGLALTLILVLSGMLAALAVGAYRRGRPFRARKYFIAAAATGVLFLVLKSVDYAQHAAAGHGLSSHDFWAAYILSTGFHFAHVLVGTALLVVAAWRVASPADTRPGTDAVDPETLIAGSALFWHMCDIAWFFLFPLFYAPISG